MFRLLAIIFVSFIVLYQVAALICHGLVPSLWPQEVLSPGDWFGFIISLQIARAFTLYWEMAVGRSPAFPNGGFWYFWLLLSPLIVNVAIFFFGKPKQQLRDTSGVYGDARFADEAELSRLSSGLELGIDPATGRAVRVQVEGTLVTLAPPRKGKTWGLLIPNLAFAEPTSWAGPVVVLDTKGEVFRAVADRRRELGRRVICLDPLELVGGVDSWNPLASVDPDDILYLQRTALALLPEATDGSSEASAYFRNRAVDLIVGAMVVALNEGAPSPQVVRDLLDDEQRLTAGLKALGDQPSARAALAIMDADPKTRDPIRSTAAQSFQWLSDARLSATTQTASFELSDLSSGTVDLFIAVPPQYRLVLAPFLRWLLSDLFSSVRLHRPVERILVMIDEAAALGYFYEVLTAANELPGYGMSTWLFFQDRSQVTELYGESGANTLLNTAEVITIFNVSAVDPDETERWSRVVGEYTALVAVKGISSDSKATTTNHSPQPARLMPPSAIATMPHDELLALISNPRHGGRPLRLKKTTAYNDPRYRRFVITVPPIGTIGG